MIRILHVVAIMNRGGLETMIMNYYRNINRDKVQFDFLVHRNEEGAYDKEILSLGGRIYRVPPFNPFHHITYLRSLDGFFKTHGSEYSIVHSHYNSLGAYALRYAKKYEVPTRIAHSHNSKYSLDYKIPIFLYSKAILKRYANTYFACGRESGEWLFGKNVQFTIMSNAIDISAFKFNEKYRKEIRQKYGIGDELVIGHVGRFNKSKNHKYIIEVFEKLSEINPSAKLMFVGSGDSEEVSARQLVNDLGLARSVMFVGNQSEVYKFLSAFDVFIFPSIHEGLPVTLVEAQASGLPCIVSDTIPKECKITNLVRFLPIAKHDISKWVEYISQIKTDNRSQGKFNGVYDIKVQAKVLEKFYTRKTQASDNVHN